jgi:hypothetical protein
LKSFDAPHYALQCGGLADFKGKARVDVEGANGGEVTFNCFGKNGTLLAGVISCPGHETDLRGWKQLARGDSILRVELYEIEERPLRRGIGLPSGRSKSVP